MFVSRLGATVIKRSQVDGVISEKDELLVSESLNLLSHGRMKGNEVISVMWLDLRRQSLSMHEQKHHASHTVAGKQRFICRHQMLTPL